MKKFERAHVPKSESDALRAEFLKKPIEFFEKWVVPCTRERIEAFVDDIIQKSVAGERWNNDKYQVVIFDDALDEKGEFPAMWHLSIKRHDRAPIFNFRDLQTLKNELIGPENEAVQLFPAESRLVDGANQYHLFALKDPTVRFPFGFKDRLVTDEPIGKSRNRPILPVNEGV
jgi:hypothetical protein